MHELWLYDWMFVNGRSRPSWTEYALTLAKAAATRSEDPYVQVGACVLRYDHSVAAVGYNGPPSGVDVDWSDRDKRRPRMVHAEANALRHTNPRDDLWLLAATLMPCQECLKTAAAYGIREIVYAEKVTNYQVYDEELIRELATDFKIDLRYSPLD